MGRLYDEYHRKERGIGASQQCIFSMCLSVAPSLMLNFLATTRRFTCLVHHLADRYQRVSLTYAVP